MVIFHIKSFIISIFNNHQLLVISGKTETTVNKSSAPVTTGLTTVSLTPVETQVLSSDKNAEHNHPPGMLTMVALVRRGGDFQDNQHSNHKKPVRHVSL